MIVNEDKIAKARAFLAEIETVCQKYQISIGIISGIDEFVLVPYDDYYMRWLKDSNIEL